MFTKWNDSLDRTAKEQLKQFTDVQSSTLNKACTNFIQTTVQSFITNLQNEQALTTDEVTQIEEELHPNYVWRTAHLQNAFAGTSVSSLT